MKNKWVIFAAIACAVFALAALSACSKNPASEGTGTVSGVLYGVIEVPRDSLPEESRPEHQVEMDRWYPLGNGEGRTQVRLIANNTVYQFRRTYPVDHLEVEVGGQKAVLAADGSFRASGVPVGENKIVFKIDGAAAREQVFDVGSDFAPVEVDVVCGKHDCGVRGDGVDPAGTAAIPCLDNNGVGPGRFVFSDCFMSLTAGPPWYSWMCWAEAMNTIHDHHGNVWCNGSHNCSLFVHGWDWNKQFWHTHSFLWTPKW